MKNYNKDDMQNKEGIYNKEVSKEDGSKAESEDKDKQA